MSRYRNLDVYIPATAASPVGGGRPIRRILVPVDSLGRADGALALAARLCAEVDGQLRLVHARAWDPPIPGGAGRFFWESSEQATEVLDKALTSVWARGVPASGVVVEAVRNRVARAIAAEARGWGAEIMVIARRSRTMIGVLLLGSMSDQLMREAGCPVLVTQQERRHVSR
jgi:nucleotide-binding universal stress UspA family protein